MFDVSFTELMVIGVIALIVIGPERLPKVARTVGHLLGRAQRYVNDVKSDIRREIELDELRKFKSEMENAAQTVQTSMRETGESLREPAQALRQELDDAARAATGAISLQPEPSAAATPAIAPPATENLSTEPLAVSAEPAAVAIPDELTQEAPTEVPAKPVAAPSAGPAPESAPAIAAFPPVDGTAPKSPSPTGSKT